MASNVLKDDLKILGIHFSYSKILDQECSEIIEHERLVN